MSDAPEPERHISVYVTPACPHCRATREFLSSLGAPFDVYDVTVDRVALQRLIWLTGSATVPATVAGSEVLLGFDPTRLREMVEALRNPPRDETPEANG
jgi:glutaredoxin